MEIVDSIAINIIHLITPYAIYLFYLAYKKTYNEKENELIFIITIFTSLYICLKYNLKIINSIPLMSINIPLMLSYYKKNNIAIITSSIIILLYSFKFYSPFLLLLLIEYISYGLIYKYLKIKNFNYFIIIFSIIKILFSALIVFIKGNTYNIYLELLALGIIFLITSLVIIYFLKEGENILRIHMISKEIEHDKQIKDTLFRITHEIKNPIAVCKGYLDMFDIENKQHAKKYIPIIKNEITKTLVLLEDFLSLNKIKIEKDILDINIVLEEVISSFKLYLKEHKIKLKQIIKDEEIYINGDYNRLREVLVNIIKNSIEAIKKEGTITIWTETKNENIYIYIKDNGIGIDKETLKKIDEPFFTTKQKGTGLGVPLSKEIIERHNGKLIYESEKQKFTLVTIILPILKII